MSSSTFTIYHDSSPIATFDALKPALAALEAKISPNGNLENHFCMMVTGLGFPYRATYCRQIFRVRSANRKLEWFVDDINDNGYLMQIPDEDDETFKKRVEAEADQRAKSRVEDTIYKNNNLFKPSP